MSKYSKVRQTVKSKICLCHTGLTVLLHHELTVRVGLFRKEKKVLLHVPARKIVRCRTRELHQSLLVKLGSCLLEKTELPAGSVPKSRAPFIAKDMAMHMVSSPSSPFTAEGTLKTINAA